MELVRKRDGIILISSPYRTAEHETVLQLLYVPDAVRGYRGGSLTTVQAWPLWEPSPSHPILL